MERITYAIDTDTGLAVSRQGDCFAWPILDYEGMTPDNGFAANYYLEKIPVLSVAGRVLAGLQWTRKIPMEVKNLHRVFWGMAPLKEGR